VNRPVIETPRLTLRLLQKEDAPALQRLVSSYEIALNTLSIPHPYPESAAEEWIAMSEKGFDEGRMVNLAIIIRESGEFAGSIGLVIKPEHDKAEIGYWIGVPFWNRGYATEAAKAIIDYGFAELKLNRIDAGHFDRNPSSGRVMQKLGMQYEGRLRQSIKKWDEYLDVEYYAILRSEWAAQTR
jgi:[ribosomal protein S5]-alanine N-acetyltransferase